MSTGENRGGESNEKQDTLRCSDPRLRVPPRGKTRGVDGDYSAAYNAGEHDVNQILRKNREWAARTGDNDPTFFFKLATGQQPKFLWIGCSDSRVPENKLMGVEPGEVFVHRNVANLVHGADSNLLSVLTYAIEALQIKHIMVVGHYDCGGVRAAMANQRALGGPNSTIIDNWLTGVRDVYRIHSAELDAIEDNEARHRRLVELNVVEQCLNVFKAPVVQQQRLRTYDQKKRTGRPRFAYPRVHAMVFNPADGILSKLQTNFKEELGKFHHVYDVYGSGDAEWFSQGSSTTAPAKGLEEQQEGAWDSGTWFTP